MSNFFKDRLPSFDAKAINDTIQRALSSAGIDTSSGPMKGVTQTIRNALASAGGATAAERTTPAAPSHSKNLARTIIDVVARVVPDAKSDAREPSSAQARPGPAPSDASHTAPSAAPGRFTLRRYTSEVGTRAYKLYVPTKAPSAPMAMIVMLHGCTQSPDDFAAGTRMNLLAEQHGFVVVYPEQPSSANMSKCWNWFQSADQSRGGGEPALIAGMVAEVQSELNIDRRRVFVAGLSAGAAMAVIMGETYPDVFAGIGVHSGLPFASAHDIPSAMVAMKGGRSGMPGLGNVQGTGPLASVSLSKALPTIVFHGDRDHTVQQANGAAIVQQASDAYAAAAGRQAPLSTSTQQGRSAGGQAYTRTLHAAPGGVPIIESWVLHGAGHAWSGGDASGSYTESSGPDASAEMVRFFMAQTRSGSA